MFCESIVKMVIPRDFYVYSCQNLMVQYLRPLIIVSIVIILQNTSEWLLLHLFNMDNFLLTLR